MTTVTLDAAAMACFQGVADYAAIRDEAGQIVGYFCPTRQPPRGPDGKIVSPISDEELKRRSNEKGGRPLKDILADLGKAMSFTVTWKPAAERELTELWLASSTRQEIRAAADSIDRQLARDPANFGEAREGNQRIAIVVPLVVEFEVREEDRIVNMQAVRTC